MKTYRGKKSAGKLGDQVIIVEEEPYRLKHIVRHSPSGFNWGYGGSGPLDTALSILTDCLGRKQADQLHEPFQRVFVATWGNEWSISEKEIKDWAKKQQK